MSRARGADGLPERIAAVRLRLGLSQRAFAARSGVGRNVVIRWERGYHRPSAARLRRIAKLGGVTIGWLLNGGEGRGERRDRQWEETVTALRVAWADRQRRGLASGAAGGGRGIASGPGCDTRQVP
jgi:transcriptional regulator with XRE-family HTH domain